MKELSTIQKREKLNRVFACDEACPGGASYEYGIMSDKGLQVPKEQVITFQKGPRNEDGSIHGVTNEDLLEIVRDRLKSFQAGPFSSRENACALTHVEEALMWMNRRVEDRIERNVLGKNEK
ncbi:ABC transporter ATPase [Clostridium botulinum]|nr:ABC transporter ATPase [Clostridium botulinum]NFO54216.1 ABC transporter ATPase [Clostridium botulinum]